MNDLVLYGIGAGLFVVILLGLVWLLRRRQPRQAEADPAFAWGEPAEVPPAPPAPAPAPTQWAAPAAAPPRPVPLAPAPPPAPVPAPEFHADPPAAPSGPVHVCKCPNCQTQFSVTGAKPIVTNCPGCGKKGYLR